MDGEEVLIAHAGYTVTAYTSCGKRVCTETILRSVGVSKSIIKVHGTDLSGETIGDDAQVTVAPLGESDHCEWCACCGKFTRHGIKYPGEGMGCPHGEGETPPDLPGPHIDLRGAPAMRNHWASLGGC